MGLYFLIVDVTCVKSLWSSYGVVSPDAPRSRPAGFCSCHTQVCVVVWVSNNFQQCERGVYNTGVTRK